MNQNLTHIEVIMDRSGSMATIREDMEGGFSNFIKQQREEEGEATVSFTRFDNEIETVHEAVNINDFPAIRLEPRGSTALYDAVGKRINECGARLAAMDEADRPGLVIFVIITDGEENASSEFTSETLKQMIETQTNDFNWDFIYLGANQDAMLAGGSIGIAMSQGYTANTLGVRNMYSSTSQRVSTLRAAARQTSNPGSDAGIAK